MPDHQLVYMPPNMLIYQGDSLPSFASAIEDDRGNVIDLTAAASAYLQIRHPDGTVTEFTATIVSGASGVVTYDWTGDDTAALVPGVHELAVRIVWDDGDELIAPSDRRAQLVVRPALSSPT